MKLHSRGIVTASLAAVATIAAIASVSNSGAKAEDMAGVTKAVAVLQSTAGNEAHGTVTFTQQADGVLIEAHVMGLTPGKHGFHIHEFGDISAEDGTSAGGHFNPAGHNHGGPDDDARHVGDLGNIEADENGHGMYKRLDTVVELNGPNSIVGRGLIVHAGTDDLKTQPTGDAGGRVAMGVIGVAKP